MDMVVVEKWTPERRRQLTRDALLDAAAVVFARRGFHGASLEEIADTAGFTRGAIYKNFADKEDLLLAVWDRVNERTLREFDELLDDGGLVLDADHVAVVATKWRELQTRDRDASVLDLEFVLYLLRNPEVRDRVLAHRRAFARRLARFIEQRASAAAMELPMPAEDLANIFLISSGGFTTASLIDPELARLYQPFLELLTRALAASQTFTTLTPT
jgi:AcrR family transcriptional regulator